MGNLTFLRRLSERQIYHVLRDACLQEETGNHSVRVLYALAAAQLGDAVGARNALDGLDVDVLGRDARIDLAAVYLALGGLDQASDLLESELEKEQQHSDRPHSLLLARLGYCRLQQQRIEEAFLLFQTSLALTPRVPVFQTLLRLCVQQQRLDTGWSLLKDVECHWQQERDHWPEDSAAFHDQLLRKHRLDMWLLDEAFDAAESWLEDWQTELTEADWCALLGGYARRLQGRDRHAQAEERLRAGLQRYPDNLVLLLQLADLVQLQGRTVQGVALLRRAINAARMAEEPTIGLWLQLASSAQQNNPALARDAVIRAKEELETLPEHRLTANQRQVFELQLELALAGVEAQEQNYAGAEPQYRRCLAAQPHNVQALQGLGQMLMQLGRIDEAVDCFEQLKTIDPARGHGALINARHFPDDDATLASLEQLARTPGQEGSVRASLLLQLAVAWEKRKDYAKAFVLADEANTASRKLLNYDPVAHRQRCARIRHAFNRELYEHRGGLGNHSTLPVFVLGMPRSGTTLIEQILAGHSQIHGAGELGVIPGVIAGLERWERRVGSGRHYPDCVDDLSAKVIAGITGNILKELQEYAPEALHVVDKLPHNFENIGLIKLLFPNARIISVRRDPRDIAISNYFTDYAAKHGGMGFAYDLTWIGEQLADHNLLLHHWNQLFPSEILEVRYEDVLADPEREARRMLEYIGVAWEPQVLNFSELQRPVKTASVWQVRQPLYTTSMAKWERYKEHLAPLIRGTNSRIEWQPITDMVTLPVPGLLETAVAFYREEKLDDAEYHFKQLLHHLPEHAAATFMVGLIYVRKGHLDEGIALMLKAHEQCPWNGQWRDDLAQAYEMSGEPEKAALLRRNNPRREHDAAVDNEQEINGEFAW